MRSRTNLKITFLFLLCWLMAIPAFGEFYQYTDKNGSLRFTDNIGDVPVDRIKTIKSYNELAPEVGQMQNQASGVSDVRDKKNVQAAKKPESIEQTADILSKEKAELDREFADLQAEKEALLKPPRKYAAPEAVKAYTKQVEELNNRIKAYEAKRTAFKKKVNDFEARVRASKKK